MKQILSFVVLAFVLNSTASFAAIDSKKIKTVATKLGELLADFKTYNLKPASPIEMMKELAVKELQEDEADFHYDVEDSLQGDGGAWGIHPMATAIHWVSNAEYLTIDEAGEEIMNSPKAKKAADLVKSLYGTGVVFGAGPFGAVQCGGTYPALLMIDTAKGVIYKFDTEGSGC
ncbi:MAG: hypothetical protein ACOYL6_03220 [Bacteriovoracaceae bacterium]